MVGNNKEPSLHIDKRIEFLTEFRKLLLSWDRGFSDRGVFPAEEAELRRQLNKMLITARKMVIHAGALRLMTIGPPPAVGGALHKNIDPFENFFQSFWGRSLTSVALDCVDQAIGVYEQALENPDFVNFNHIDGLDVETAIDRALRPSFRSVKPTCEKEIQDAIENILNTLGVFFVRDKEVAPTGPRASRPDFTVASEDLAIEAKLAKEGHGASAIQEEINADITAYKTKWKRLIFVIYDLGTIDNPQQMKDENQRLFGVSILVIKH